jgi:hypothetical protein
MKKLLIAWLCLSSTIAFGIIGTVGLIVIWSLSYPETAYLAAQCFNSHQPPEINCNALGRKIHDDVAAFVEHTGDPS